MTKVNEVVENPNYRKLLDHGFVGLVDSMGDDSSIVQAARVSYGTGTKKVSEDRGLIRYLLRHEHTTPFEMIEFKFHCKMPIFVARQWIRHRTANVNEYSGRYSVMSDEFYIPERNVLKAQSTLNKQGSDGELSDIEATMVQNTMKRVSAEAYVDYLSLLNEPGGRDYNIDDRKGLSRELARTVLPVNNYTEWFWKIDLHNLFRFLRLRADSHAQYEIRVFAEAMLELIRPKIPLAIEAWEDYVRNSENLSVMEYRLINDIINVSNQSGTSFINSFKTILELCTLDGLLIKYKLNKREYTEFLTRWKLEN